jgi:uncharacterized membrane protein YeaQ/YmgE (transglycosylase-associated protein family)
MDGAANHKHGVFWSCPSSKEASRMLAPESVIAWIIIGAVAGWLAGLLVKGYGFGLIGNIIVGILGAGIAGFLAPSLGLYTASTGGNIIAATLGAIILLFLIGLVRRT